MDLTAQRNQAMYVASVTPSHSRFVHLNNPGRDMPAGLAMSDLDFLNPDSSLFNVTHVMSSAGQAMRQTEPCFISARDRSRTTVIGDSGGFQIIGGILDWEGDKTREAILRWLEANVDWAMTLDVPTRAVQNPKSGYKTFQECLRETLKNLDYFQRHRNHDAPTKFLNVLQGETIQQADKWFDAVKGYEFEGWAFAGKHRFSLRNMCKRIIQMADQRLIQDRDWIHILGTNRITQALGFTALQRAINKHINENLRISYDTSSPFQLTGRWHSVYSLPNINHQQAVLQTSIAPDGFEYVGSGIPFPWPSPVGDQILCGDICVKEAAFERTFWDALSLALMINHNYASLLNALAQAHRVLDMQPDFASRYLPSLLREQLDVVDHVICKGSMAEVSRNAKVLDAYAITESRSDAWLNGEPDSEDD